MILSLSVEGDPLAGEPLSIAVAARDPQRSLTGAVTDGAAQSACRTTRRGADDTTGAFTPGHAVALSLPYVPATPGVRLVGVQVRSGGCGGVEAVASDVVAITVTLPPLARTAVRGRVAACAGARTAPDGRNGARIRAATLCLLNAERAARGLGAFREDRRLREAAVRHSRDMVARRFFDHVGPDGPSLARRLERAGYWPAAVGENIGGGGGSSATPRGMVALWMDSDVHRANILARSYRRIGIGVVARDPDGGRGATYTTDFGSRLGR